MSIEIITAGSWELMQKLDHRGSEIFVQSHASGWIFQRPSWNITYIDITICPFCEIFNSKHNPQAGPKRKTLTCTHTYWYFIGTYLLLPWVVPPAPHRQRATSCPRWSRRLMRIRSINSSQGRFGYLRVTVDDDWVTWALLETCWIRLFIYNH